MGVADVFRIASVAGGLVLVTVSWAAAALVGSWSQRGRCVVLGGLGALVSSTAIAAIGRPIRWEVPTLTMLVWAGCAFTVPLIVAELRRIAGGRSGGGPPG
jgi:hypothetical protein